MKLGSRITSIVLTGTLASVLALTGCASESQQVAPLDIKPASLGITTLAALPEVSAPEQEIPSDEVVEVVDPTTGETTTMTAAEAKASGKTIVNSSSSGSTPQASSGSSSQAPAASSSAPSAPAHKHSWQPVYGQAPKIVIKPAYSVLHCLTCGYECSSDAQMSAHKQAQGFGSSHAHTVIEHDAQYGYGEAPVIGYKCSCGATK